MVNADVDALLGEVGVELLVDELVTGCGDLGRVLVRIGLLVQDGLDGLLLAVPPHRVLEQSI